MPIDFEFPHPISLLNSRIWPNLYSVDSLKTAFFDNWLVLQNSSCQLAVRDLEIPFPQDVYDKIKRDFPNTGYRFAYGIEEIRKNMAFFTRGSSMILTIPDNRENNNETFSFQRVSRQGVFSFSTLDVSVTPVYSSRKHDKKILTLPTAFLRKGLERSSVLWFYDAGVAFSNGGISIYCTQADATL
jgi:hypothetical protein